MDTQIIELIGRHHLIAELIQADLEVAIPMRDRGVDIIAYADIDKRLERFSSCPIQIKASMKRSFGLDKKYERIHNLLIAYVWNLADYEPRVTYALTYSEAFSIADSVGWTQTKSWIEGGKYVTTKPSAEHISLLEPHRMSSEKWHKKILALMGYPERELQKEDGRKLYQKGTTVAERARGIMMIIEAHFLRNPKAPSLAIYASHWLWASLGDYDHDVMDLLVSRHPLLEQPRIQRGYSDWGSYGDPQYRI